MVAHLLSLKAYAQIKNVKILKLFFGCIIYNFRSFPALLLFYLDY